MSATSPPRSYWSAADEPRFHTLVNLLGGFRTLPGIEPDTLRRVAELTHPRWNKPKGIYDHEGHEKLTDQIRRQVIKPLNMAISRQGFMSRTNLQDHGVRLYVRHSLRGIVAWWCSPYYDDMKIRDGIPASLDAELYAMGVIARLARKDLRGMVLGVGSHHPAAADLLLWDVRHDAEMKRRMKASAWPPFVREPTWFWL